MNKKHMSRALGVFSLATLALALPAVAHGHGGTYAGPGDTGPPGGFGGGNPTGPTTPSGSGPTSGPTTPTTPTPAAPGTPAGTVGFSPTGPFTGPGGPPPVDLTGWGVWWAFNRDPFLNLKAHLHAGDTTTGSDNYYLGRGGRIGARDTHAPGDEQIRQIVVALLDALENESDADIVTGCLIALAKIGDEKAENGESAFEDVFTRHLKDANREISETAAVALGILANPAAIPTLAALVKDDPGGRRLVGAHEVHWRVRAFAAYGLGLIGHEASDDDVRRTVLRHLLDVLASDTGAVLDVHVACMVSFGLTALETMESPQGDAAPESSRTAQIEWLLATFRDHDNEDILRAHAPTAMVRLLDRSPSSAFEGYEQLKRAIFDELAGPLAPRSKERAEIVRSSVIALGLLADNDADPLDERIRATLLEASKDLRDEQARLFAKIAVARSAGRTGAGPEPGAGMDEAIGLLSRSLARARSHNQRAWSAIAMGVLGQGIYLKGVLVPDHLSAPIRVALAKERSPALIGPYAIAAGLMREQESAERLRKHFAELREDETRGYVAVALGLMGDRLALEPIQRQLAESQLRPELLSRCAIALGLLGDKHVGLQLVEMLASSNSLASQSAIASALGFIGDQNSIEPLVDLLKEAPQPKVRAFAAVALGVIADKEPLPWNSKIAVGLNYRASVPTLMDMEGLGILNIL
ncbi:MAG: HEAT repeat domain-containing protein [Planctomycetota bacterium]|nr:HEAT repeat domain-containing protein [Planctomycetota bacterium]